MVMDSIDIVIPFGNGSIWSNNELIYCLRSIEKNIVDAGEIWIVGEQPPVSNNIHFLPLDDPYESKSKNIATKIYAYCCSKYAKEKFVVFNDDYFVINTCKLNRDTIYYKNNLIEELNNSTKEYAEYIENTYDLLTSLGHTIYNFDTHYPILFEKKKFIDLYERFYRNSPNDKLLIRSMYYNYYISDIKIAGQLSDCKIRKNLTRHQLMAYIRNYNMFSIGDRALVHQYGEPCSVKDLLKELFPNKSKYEDSSI